MAIIDGIEVKYTNLDELLHPATGTTRHMNAGPNVAGIVINRYKPTAEQQFRESEIRERYGDLVVRDDITERTALPTAHADGRSIHSARTEGGKVLSGMFDELYTQLVQRSEARV